MIKTLPPRVKNLLKLRNPYPMAAPSSQTLQQRFRRTFDDAQSRRVETGWLVLTTCTLLTANRPSTLGELYRFVSSNATIPQSVNRAAIMREAALKSTIFVGVPRVILSLSALHEALDAEVKGALRGKTRRQSSPESVQATLTRGNDLWESIYAPHAGKLHDKLRSYHPDFIAFIIQSYGSVLSPLPGATRSYTDDSSQTDTDQGNLSRTQGSVVGIACLRAEGRVIPQLTSHVFGLLKARHVEHQTEEDRWLSSDEGTEWVIRSVDEVLELLEQDSGEQEQLQAKM